MIISKSIISAQRALNGNLTPEMGSPWQASMPHIKSAQGDSIELRYNTYMQKVNDDNFKVDYLGPESSKWHSDTRNGFSVSSINNHAHVNTNTANYFKVDYLGPESSKCHSDIRKLPN